MKKLLSLVLLIPALVFAQSYPSPTYQNLTVNGTSSLAGTISGAGVTSLFASPPSVGSTAPGTGAFTTVSASSTVSGTGFVNRFSSPGPIGNTAASTGAFTTLSATGAFTPSQTNGIVGTTTNNNANAGSVGELVTSTVTSLGLASGTQTNITSISLTAGDWDVEGNCVFLAAATTTISAVNCGVSTTSATLPGIPNYSIITGLSLAANAQISLIAPRTRISVASTTTVYLTGEAVFATSTLTGNGVINARRVR